LVFLLFFVTVIELPAMLFLGLWFFWQVLHAMLSLGPGDVGSQDVAFWAHVGGFVAGLLLMPSLSDLLRPRPKPPTSDLRPPTSDL
jgi:membrane associated rhomboid family serine protease